MQKEQNWRPEEFPMSKEHTTRSKNPVKTGKSRPGPRILQRKCACGASADHGGECEDCKKKSLQRRAAGAAGPQTAPPVVHEVLRSPGQPLDPATRGFFEQRMGHDFSKVRVHADGKAQESAHAVNALAYTVGNDIAFAAGTYAPRTAAGKELIGHELAHVLQQQSGSAANVPPGELEIGSPSDPAERNADISMRAALAGALPGRRNQPGAKSTLRRQIPKEPKEKPQDPNPQPQDTQKPDVISGTDAPVSTGQQAAPTCQPAPLARDVFLSQKRASTDDFGLTTLDVTAVTYPEVNTIPAKPRGVTVAPTTASLPNIPSVFTGQGTFVEGDVLVVGGDDRGCPSKKYPIRWTITKSGASQIGMGEQEHCSDFQYAFDISLKQFAAAVNTLAASKRVFASDAAVKKELKQMTGVHPDDWQTVFICLAKKSLLRDPSKKGGTSWHTPRVRQRTPEFPDCKEARVTLSDASLPEIGQHPSSEIIKGCGEKAAAAPAQKGPKQ